MEIRQLITFQTIIETGSYTGAAHKLGYTQSTITSHIQGLEEESAESCSTTSEKNCSSHRLVKN